MNNNIFNKKMLVFSKMIKELSRDTSEFNNYVFNKFKEEDKRRTILLRKIL